MPDSHGHPALARHTDNAEAMWSGLRTVCTLMIISHGVCIAMECSGANALIATATQGHLRRRQAARVVLALMRTLVLLSLFSFVVNLA
ncbi:hypothetical protein ACNKHL_09890 [Shigella flexneri]